MRTLLASLVIALFPTFGHSACLPIVDERDIVVSEEQLANIGEISFTRADLFASLQATAEYETSGCWAAPVGNFDAQTLSVGVSQWNYGQNSLQGLMRAYMPLVAATDGFNNLIGEVMPTYGQVAFSENCLAVPLVPSCKEAILAAHDPSGKLNPTISAEYEALFNSLPMRQVQVNTFITYLGTLAPKLKQTFGEQPTSLQTRWGIDLAIQQGFVRYNDPATGAEQSAFLNPSDVTNVRAITSTLTTLQKRNRMLSTIRWYSGLCGSVYQGVVADQCNYNIKHWCAVAWHGVSDEQFDLFTLTAVRSRIATGQSGRWQANAFARRAKIVLATGQVGSRQLDLPKGVRRTRRCNNMLVRL